MSSLGLSRAAVYRRASAEARRLGVTTDIGMFEVATAAGVNFMRFASAEDLQILRNARMAVPSVAAPASVAATTGRPAKAKAKGKAKRPPGKRVWVVHGRDIKLRNALFDFIRSIGLEPLEWEHAVKATRSGAPYVGEVLDAAFRTANAVIVLLTPDDVAQLKREHWQRGEPSFEKKLTGQARPNVLFEAGIAFGTHPTRTVLVQVGEMRPFSDTAGRLVVKFHDSAPKRKELERRLAAAGCETDTSGDHWLTAGDFSSIK